MTAIDGIHAVTIGPVLDGGPPLPYRIEIAELLTVDQYRERLQQSRSDPRVTWLRENALRIESLAQDDDDFSDLRPLEEILAQVDIVMLGEATHWDGPTFYAKTSKAGRHSPFTNAIRVSPGAHTTFQGLDRFIAAVDDVAINGV